MKKISVKNLYLLLIICIGLVCLGIGSTYAMFTTSAEIDSPIVLSSNLTYDSNIMDTIEVEVTPGRTVSSILNITNSSGTTLNYTAWYLDEGQSIEIGTSGGIVSGSLDNNGSTSINVDIRNNSSENVVVLLGIASSSESIVLSSGMKKLPS